VEVVPADVEAAVTLRVGSPESYRDPPAGCLASWTSLVALILICAIAGLVGSRIGPLILLRGLLLLGDLPTFVPVVRAIDLRVLAFFHAP
jgi:hypothetical protein